MLCPHLVPSRAGCEVQVYRSRSQCKSLQTSSSGCCEECRLPLPYFSIPNGKEEWLLTAIDSDRRWQTLTLLIGVEAFSRKSPFRAVVQLAGGTAVVQQTSWLRRAATRNRLGTRVAMTSDNHTLETSASSACCRTTRWFYRCPASGTLCSCSGRSRCRLTDRRASFLGCELTLITYSANLDRC